ncbi:hypothetical protein JXA84_08490, partial [candidate division WOR-3 bacterium]|nr:hypothetical protein [candidate division WOR-3 bacterium]
MIIIDSSSIAYRSYFALQRADLKTPDGRESGAVYGFLQTLLSLKKSFPGHDLVAVFDSSKPSFRRDYYEGYKANRERMPEPLAAQVEALVENLPFFGCPVLKMEKFEADDIIASLVRVHSFSEDILILSKDKDLAQLVKKNICLIYPGKSGDWNVMNEKTVKFKFGVEPSQIKDFLVLTGDTSDNIPGVPGVGPKTAAKLLEKGGDLEEIIRNPEIYASKKIALSIKNSKDIIDRAKKLIELKSDLEVPDIQALKNKKVSKEFMDFLIQWGLKKMARELGFERDEKLDLDREEKSLYFEGGFISASHRDGILLWSGEELDLSDDKNILKKRKDKNIIVSDDIKRIMVDENFIPDKFEDLGTASYIIDPESGPFDCVSIVRKHTGIISSFEKSLLSLPGLWKILKTEMDRLKLVSLYENIEKPLIPIVSEMEKRGVYIDCEYLQKMSLSFTKELQEIEEGIRKITGREVNPRSPKQLSDYLFDELKLPSVSKTKTGLSTDSHALEQIRALHPIVDLILEHRFISKMLSTYIDVIPSLTDENRRLHCKFDLRATATGRFSSRDPNLQNIPFKNPRAKEIRKAFKAPGGKKLLSADYSQIELRLAAHLSGDETFLKAFRDGED